MLTRTVRFQLVAFLVIAVLGISYLAVRYVGILNTLGAGGYAVRVDLSQSGGLFSNAEITYRGVPVGRVGDLRLTKDGIQADLNITSDTKIPSSVQAVVANRSVIGEQYLDLRPTKDGGPYLHDGSLIAQRDTALPPPVQDLLQASEGLVQSVPIGSLQTVVGELYDATKNLSSSNRQLIDASQLFYQSAGDNLPQTIDLIQTSKTVLATQNAESAQILTFAQNLKLIGEQLRASNGDISKILSTATPAVTEITGFTKDITGSARALLTNLLTTSTVFLGGKDGLREVFVKLPVAISIGGSVITPQGINVGLVPNFFDPLPCTSGYGGTQVRQASNTSGNPALNTTATCTNPPSGGEVRGSQNAPGNGS